MLRLFISIVALIGMGRVVYAGHQLVERPSVPSWHVAPTEVTSGGCVHVVINAASREAYDWMLRIDDRKPRKLLGGLGPVFRYRGMTIVILAFDLMNPEGFRMDPNNPDEIQIVPIFEGQGEVRLAIESGEKSLGTETVTVLPASHDALEAVQILYPVLVKKKGLSDAAHGTWMQLLTDPMFGITPPITPEQLQQLRDELPIIMKHPDWAEIAELLVARLEARLHSRGLIVREEGRQPALKETLDELPPWPDIVTRCLKAKSKSPFAQAIQKDIRGTIKNIRILDAQRRGEDVMKIIMESSKPER